MGRDPSVSHLTRTATFNNAVRGALPVQRAQDLGSIFTLPQRRAVPYADRG